MCYVLGMTPTDISCVLRLYQEICPASFFADLVRRGAGQAPAKKGRQEIYTGAVVVWLMMLQRLHPQGTLGAAVEQLVAGQVAGLLPDSKRVRERRVSAHTGAYCQARQRLPKLLAEQVLQKTIEHHAEQLRQGWPDWPFPVFVVDGSTLQLEHQPELVAAYPPAHNQHGVSHWPILQILVLHDTYSGMALPPVCGPMYGPQAVSEQGLLKRAIAGLPRSAVLLGDRNFGTFATAYEARAAQHDIVFRLTRSRARRLAGGKLQPGEQAVVWRPSPWDRKAHPELPAEASVPGRLLIFSCPGARESQLYLFTTLDLPAEQILRIYGRRWNIETDLRSLKQTVHLERLTAKSKDMVEKELLLAMAAYNLIRVVMCLAAEKAGLMPRDLSFSRVRGLVIAFLPRLADQQPGDSQDREFQYLLDCAARCRLPKRRRSRSYPRLVWGRGYRFLRRKPLAQ